jgi:NAD(P)H-dependent FMN reductase
MESGLDIVSVVGSLRAGSINRATFTTARELAPSGVHMTEIDIRDVPLYNAGTTPPPVSATISRSRSEPSPIVSSKKASA